MKAKFVNKEQLIESVRKLPCFYDTSRKEKKGNAPFSNNKWPNQTYQLIKRGR